MYCILVINPNRLYYSLNWLECILASTPQIIFFGAVFCLATLVIPGAILVNHVVFSEFGHAVKADVTGILVLLYEGYLIHPIAFTVT